MSPSKSSAKAADSALDPMPPELTVLNGVLRYTVDGYEYEADPVKPRSSLIV